MGLFSRPSRAARTAFVEDREGSIRRRMIFSACCLGLGLLGALVQVGYLQFAEGNDLDQWARRNYVRSSTLDEWRGDVLDRKGGLLAVTVHRWSLSADPTRVPEDEIERISNILAELTGKSPARFAKKLAGNNPQGDSLLDADPTTLAARAAVQPVAQAVAKVFGFSVKRFERKMSLLEYFYRTDQLRTRGVYRLVDTLDRIADLTARAISAGAHELRFFPSSGRKFVYLGRNLDDESARNIGEARTQYRLECQKLWKEGRTCSNPLRAITLIPEPRRYYPRRGLTTQLVGLVGSDSKGLEGIERSMDELLSGKQHKQRIVRDRRGRSIYLEGIPDDAPLAAHSIELTIDPAIQSLAASELGKACRASGARAGYTMVMHVKTGEVLAAASYPPFNPNDYQNYYAARRPLSNRRRALTQARANLNWASEWPGLKNALSGQHKSILRDDRRSLNEEMDAFEEFADANPNGVRHTAFQSFYEPGSIMKVFTLAAWLEEGIRPLNHQYQLMDGEWELGDADDNVIHDDHRFEEQSIDVAHALKTSSNIVYGQMGMELGAETLERYLRAFGFGAKTQAGFPGETSGRLRSAAEWTLVENINIAFGQGIAATGIQLVTALSALANNGVRMRPILLRRVLDADGNEVKRWKPEAVAEVVSAKTAKTVIDIMKTVVEPGGTGTRAFIPEQPVAGKTGTGQKPHLRKKGYAENLWVATFFGVGPADDPELAVLVLVDEPKGKRYGGAIAAPVFATVMRGALKHMGVPSPYNLAQQKASLPSSLLAERRAFPAPAEDTLHEQAPPVNADDAGTTPVPNFAGMTMDQVYKVATTVGLKVRFVGSGTATTQDQPPHRRISIGDLVTVVFKPKAPDAVIAHNRANLEVGSPSLSPQATSGSEKAL